MRPSSAQRRGPVLLRGGFDSRSYAKPGVGSSPAQRQSVSPSHSPIRDFTRLTSPRMTAEEQAEKALGSWRRYKLNEGEPTLLQQQESSSTRRQSDGIGNVLQSETAEEGKSKNVGGAGQRTAPSSLGRHRAQEDDQGSRPHE